MGDYTDKSEIKLNINGVSTEDIKKVGLAAVMVSQHEDKRKHLEKLGLTLEEVCKYAVDNGLSYTIAIGSLMAEKRKAAEKARQEAIEKEEQEKKTRQKEKRIDKEKKPKENRIGRKDMAQLCKEGLHKFLSRKLSLTKDCTNSLIDAYGISKDNVSEFINLYYRYFSKYLNRLVEVKKLRERYTIKSIRKFEVAVVLAFNYKVDSEKIMRSALSSFNNGYELEAYISKTHNAGIELIPVYEVYKAKYGTDALDILYICMSNASKIKLMYSYECSKYKPIDVANSIYGIHASLVSNALTSLDAIDCKYKLDIFMDALKVLRGSRSSDIKTAIQIVLKKEASNELGLSENVWHTNEATVASDEKSDEYLNKYNRACSNLVFESDALKLIGRRNMSEHCGKWDKVYRVALRVYMETKDWYEDSFECTVNAFMVTRYKYGLSTFNDEKNQKILDIYFNDVMGSRTWDRTKIYLSKEVGVDIDDIIIAIYRSRYYNEKFNLLNFKDCIRIVMTELNNIISLNIDRIFKKISLAEPGLSIRRNFGADILRLIDVGGLSLASEKLRKYRELSGYNKRISKIPDIIRIGSKGGSETHLTELRNIIDADSDDVEYLAGIYGFRDMTGSYDRIEVLKAISSPSRVQRLMKYRDGKFLWIKIIEQCI